MVAKGGGAALLLLGGSPSQSTPAALPACSPFCRLTATSSPGRGKSFKGRAKGVSASQCVFVNLQRNCTTSGSASFSHLAHDSKPHRPLGSPSGGAGERSETERASRLPGTNPPVTARCVPAKSQRACPMLTKKFGPCGCTGRVKSFLPRFFSKKRENPRKNASPVLEKRNDPP